MEFPTVYTNPTSQSYSGQCPQTFFSPPSPNWRRYPSLPSTGHLQPPQGSILGLLLFILYLAPLQDVILTHDLNCMFYADDTQIQIAIKDPEHSVDSVEILQACVNDVFAWNTQNMLKSNPRVKLGTIFE